MTGLPLSTAFPGLSLRRLGSDGFDRYRTDHAVRNARTAACGQNTWPCAYGIRRKQKPPDVEPNLPQLWFRWAMPAEERLDGYLKSCIVNADGGSSGRVQEVLSI